MRSLKQKIMIPVLLVAVLGISVLTSVSFFKAQEILIDDIKEITENKVLKLVVSTDSWLQKAISKIDVLSTTDAVQGQSFKDVKDYISKNSELFNDFESIIMSDKSGDFLSTTGSGGNIKERAYFPKVMNGETVISDPVISKATGNPIIVIAGPITNNSGNVVGLIGGTVNLSLITDVVNTEKLGTTGYAYMIDQNGLVMAHPNEDLIFQANFLDHESKSLVDITTKMVNREIDSDDYTFEGKEKIASYAPIPSTGWSIAMSAYYDELTEDIDQFRNLILFIASLTVLLISVAIYLLISKSIQPLKKMTNITKDVAAGNLTVTVDIKSNDEIGLLADNFNTMVDNMKTLLGEVSDMGTTVASASQEMLSSSVEAGKVSEQVAMTISDLAEGASEQARSTQEGSGMVNDLVESISQISENAQDAARVTEKTKDTVDQGMEMLIYQKSKMEENNAAAKNVSTVINGLAENSQKIGQIIDLISSIAEQTNLLALNAAIEAARAGEQGKGFAVVAEEVRTLAEQASTATQDINGLILDIKSGVDQAVKEMDLAKSIVTDQNKAALETENAFRDILEAVQLVSTNIGRVTEASKLLTNNSISVGQTIENVASITEESAAGTEEAAASTEEQSATINEISTSAQQLADLSNDLQNVIQKFRL
ncbi:methyl-accepting chemotaxis protein [Vallitalea okinawensis]|uniref:methyl-accepting chemotaxis protein n=1 Tax=Vallitalea okinawensis TaxID=2078660 RepID=UPI000CFD4876|nr:methyl-accepting chemotaxis protein [Vallitalea okinawensis]